MNTQNLIQLISSRPIKVKEIVSKIEDLKTNNFQLELFLMNNPQLNVTDFQVASELMTQATNLINKRIPLNIVKNVYDEYSIIFIIMMLTVQSKSERNKLQKMYLDILSNTSKFDMYMKVTKNVKKVSSADDVKLELFWLLPLFSNTKVLTTVDYNSFIGEMLSISTSVPGFMEGYELFSVANFGAFDKDSYKQHLNDGVLGLKKSVV